jgi:glycosyltransferase involved in cell wall biosynthesis
MLLFPTRLEGFCLSILEAMSCGIPVVTTNTSSLPEQIFDGKGGYLCPVDDVKAYAEAIRHLAEDENLRSRMGRFNRQRVLDHFTIEKMTQEYIKVYRKIT